MRGRRGKRFTNLRQQRGVSLRFISRYKFFLFLFFFPFFVLPPHGVEPIPSILRCDHKTYRCLMHLYDRCAIFAAQPREGGKEETRKGGRRASSEEELRWLPGGRWVPSFFLPTPWLAVFPSFEARAHTRAHTVPTSTILLRSSFYYHYCYYNFE